MNIQGSTRTKKAYKINFAKLIFFTNVITKVLELATLILIVNKQMLIYNSFSGYCWGVVRNLFCSISSLEKKNEESNGCCSLNYKTGVQIMAGILTIFSAVFLVLHYVKLDQMIEDKFERMFKQQPTWNLQVSDGN